jgi:hypothetical protein
MVPTINDAEMGLSRVYFNVQFYTKCTSSKPICAVLKTQMCSHQINKNITSKQSSHFVGVWVKQVFAQ